MATDTGTLYVIATPIGNLDDISTRAIATLKDVALILAEDTRHTGRLLKQLGVSTAIRSFHEHNERQKTAEIIAILKQGDNVALVSDAGTPLISDPGYFLVREVHNEQLKVSMVPGPCALLAALSVSGMATDSFVFTGFLPERESARLKALQALRQETRTMIFYEAPHRIVDFIKAAKDVFGPQREAMIARELTKKFEQIKKSDLSGLVDWLLSDTDHQRGEFVVVLAGAAEEKTDTDELNRIIKLLSGSLSLRDTVKLACEITGANKNEVYELALSIQESDQKQ